MSLSLHGIIMPLKIISSPEPTLPPFPLVCHVTLPPPPHPPPPPPPQKRGKSKNPDLISSSSSYLLMSTTLPAYPPPSPPPSPPPKKKKKKNPGFGFFVKIHLLESLKLESYDLYLRSYPLMIIFF